MYKSEPMGVEKAGSSKNGSGNKRGRPPKLETRAPRTEKVLPPVIPNAIEPAAAPLAEAETHGDNCESGPDPVPEQEQQSRTQPDANVEVEDGEVGKLGRGDDDVRAENGGGSTSTDSKGTGGVSRDGGKKRSRSRVVKKVYIFGGRGYNRRGKRKPPQSDSDSGSDSETSDSSDSNSSSDDSEVERNTRSRKSTNRRVRSKPNKKSKRVKIPEPETESDDGSDDPPCPMPVVRQPRRFHFI